MLIFLVLLSVSAELENLDKLQRELSQVQLSIEEHSIFLSNLLKKTQDMGRDIRQFTLKSTKIISKLEKSSDVAVYKIFNSELERKHKHMDDQHAICKKNVRDGKITSRIDKILDFYVKRQQVPDPEMHQYLLHVERKIGEIAVLIRGVYNIDWLYLSLIAIAFGVVLTWRSVKRAEKRHKL